MNDTRQTTLEDRVHELEREIRRMDDVLMWMEETIEVLRSNQCKNEEDKEDFSDIKLKINIDTTEAIQQLQRIQKALQTQEDGDD